MKKFVFLFLIAALFNIQAFAEGLNDSDIYSENDLLEESSSSDLLEESSSSDLLEESDDADLLPETLSDALTDEISKDIPLLLDKSLTGKLTKQILVLIDHKISLYEKDNSWKEVFSCYAGYGRNGLKAYNERTEGDKTSPIGTFPILFSFGFGKQYYQGLSYREITPYSYWSGEEDTYNTWVESEKEIRGEHLSEYDICYKKAIAIGFNINPTVYKRGSAIFLHIKDPSSWESSGCISVEEKDLDTILSLLKDGSYIMIMPDYRYIENF